MGEKGGLAARPLLAPHVSSYRRDVIMPLQVVERRLSAVHADLRSAIAQAVNTNDEYKNALFGIVTYAGQVYAYQLPTLQNPAQWPGGASAYQQTQSTWSTTTGALQGWAQSTLQNLTALPTTLLNDGTQVVTPTLAAAIGSAQQLVAEPGDAAARANLRFALSTLASNFTLQSGLTAPLIASLEGQSAVFDQNATLMNTLASQALQTAGNDQEQIQKLNATISQLQSDIKSRAVAIAGGSLAAVLGVGMGILAIALAPETGGVSLFLLVPAILITAGGVVLIGLNSAAIIKDKEAISTAASSISSFNADITVVNTMATTLQGFAGQVDAMKSALGIVVAPWAAAETYFTQTVTTIDQLEQSSDWAQVASQLQTIQGDWQSLMTAMQGLVLNPSVLTNAELTLNMSDAQIATELARATPVPLTRYIAA